MGMNAVRRHNAIGGDAELGVGEHQIGRDNAVLQNLTLAINIAQKGVECVDPLHQPFGQLGPFVGGKDTGHNIERDDAFRTVLLTINGKGDAQVVEILIGQPGAAVEVAGRRLVQPLSKRRKFRPRVFCAVTVNLIKTPGDGASPFVVLQNRSCNTLLRRTRGEMKS